MFTIFRILRRVINYSGYVWIGLNDISTNNEWRWTQSNSTYDGDYATKDISLWYQDPDTASSSYDCGYLYSSSEYVYPGYCYSGYYFLCEKKI